MPVALWIGRTHADCCKSGIGERTAHDAWDYWYELLGGHREPGAAVGQHIRMYANVGLSQTSA